MRIIKDTRSLCPECLAILQAEIFEENEKVWIRKACPTHGEFKELYWGDVHMYNFARKFRAEGRGISNPQIKMNKPCPMSCGICPAHKASPVLGNIFVTNRCNKRCWYCFANVGKEGFVYEPDFEEIVKMMRTLREVLPLPTNAVQFTGGEPTIRRDMLDIVREARKMGFYHIQLNSNGIAFALNPELAQDYRSAGVNVVYLSFDGVTAETNPKNHRYMPAIIDACRKAGLPVTLVPTLINGVNDHEIGAIVRFAFENNDVVKSLNFQPVSFVGSMPRGVRERQRITIPDAIKKIDEQTHGEIPASSFFPITSVHPVSRFVEALTGMRQVEFTCNAACGMATYVFRDGSRMVPITEFMDVPAFFTMMSAMAKDLNAKFGRVRAMNEIHTFLGKIIDEKKAPEGLDIKKIILGIISDNYDELTRLHQTALMIGMMHFQDLYNYDIERVERCVIHYAVPGGKIIPFCAFNGIPQVYRSKIHKKHGMPIEKWEKLSGKKIVDDIIA